MEIVGLKNLCKPASVYLTVSLIAFVVMLLQNTGPRDVYCLGTYKCNTSITHFIFVIKAMYIVFWTWILNIMCSRGYDTIAWLFAIIPFLGFAIGLASVFNR